MEMKIAMLGQKDIPSRSGGVEVVVEELSVEMVHQGNEVEVYNRMRLGKSQIKNYKGVKIRTIPTINCKGLDAVIYSFFGTIRALFGKYDIVHFHAEGSCAMLWMVWMFKIKTVVTIHGLDWKREKWGKFASWYIKLGEKAAVRYANEIIVLSKNIQRYFMMEYGRKVTYIPNGIKAPIFREANIIKKKYGLEKNSYLLFLARLVPEKGAHYLIQAYKQVKTDKKLVIAGTSSHSDEYEKQLHQMASSDNRIIFTGFVQGTIWEELFSNCALYVLPSDLEGMPISLLEALSYKKRCLVSNIQENIEIINNKNYQFKKGNVIDLKQKLQFCIESDEREKETTGSYLLWEEVVKKTLNIYNKI